MPQTQHRSAWYWVEALSERWTLGERNPSPIGDPSWFTLSLSTGATDGDPYEFWRQRVYYDFSADRRVDPSLPFFARAQAVVSSRGEFVHAISADLSGARTRASLSELANANLTLGVVLAGQRDYEVGDWRHRAEPGDLYLYDAAQASRLSMSNHRVVYLSLRADAVDRALGGTRLTLPVLLRRLEQAPLRPFLHMQLAQLVESERRPAPRDAGRLLDIAIDLALLMLQQAPNLPDMEVGELRRGLVSAAHILMARHLDDPGLDVDFIAAELGVSRATLYRAFSHYNLTVAGNIRMLRLIRARHLLEHSGFSDHIGDLILACGIEDNVHFSRQFRQFFGLAPSEIKGIRSERILR